MESEVAVHFGDEGVAVDNAVALTVRAADSLNTPLDLGRHPSPKAERISCGVHTFAVDRVTILPK